MEYVAPVTTCRWYSSGQTPEPRSRDAGVFTLTSQLMRAKDHRQRHILNSPDTSFAINLQRRRTAIHLPDRLHSQIPTKTPTSPTALFDISSTPNNEAGAGPSYSFIALDVNAAGCHRFTAQSITQTSFAVARDILVAAGDGLIPHPRD